MGLLPGNYNFKIWKGATLSKEISLRDRVGVPIDLTGAGAVLNLPGLTLTDGNGLTVSNDGTVKIVMTPEQTRSFTWKRANYELLIIADETYPILTGQVIALGI